MFLPMESVESGWLFFLIVGIVLKNSISHSETNLIHFEINIVNYTVRTQKASIAINIIHETAPPTGIIPTLQPHILSPEIHLKLLKSI